MAEPRGVLSLQSHIQSFSISFRSWSGTYKIMSPSTMPPTAVQKWLPPRKARSNASSTYQIPRQINTSPMTMEMFLAKYPTVNLWFSMQLLYHHCTNSVARSNREKPRNMIMCGTQLERWLSGRKRHRAKVLGEQSPRGFESHSLRKYNVCRLLSAIVVLWAVEFEGASGGRSRNLPEAN